MMYDLKAINGIPVDFSFVKNIYVTTLSKKYSTYRERIPNLKQDRDNKNKNVLIKNHIIIESPEYLFDHQLNTRFELDKNTKELIISFVKSIIVDAYDLVKKKQRQSVTSIYNQGTNSEKHDMAFMKLVFSMMNNGVDDIIIEPTINTQFSFQCNSEYLLHHMLCYISTIFPNIKIYYHSYGNNGKTHPVNKMMNQNTKIINERILSSKGFMSDETHQVTVSISQVLQTIQKFKAILSAHT